MSARVAQRLSREAGGGSALEIAIQVGLSRGYKLRDLMRIHAAPGSAERLIGDSIEASVRRSVDRTKRLPCGEPVRIDQEKAAHDAWLAFQFQTGTKGDSLVNGSAHCSDSDHL